MNIYSCGCSFMSVDPQYPGTHFSEIVARESNGILITLARPGASNFYIGLQVEYAIKQRPELILVLFSNYDRIELLSGTAPYRVDCGIENIQGNPVDHTQAGTVSNVITNFIDQRLIDSDRKDALKAWFANIYDFGIRYHQDWFMCQGILHRLKNSGIPFVFNFGGMKYPLADPDHAWSSFKDNLTLNNPWNQLDFTPGASSGVYHTSFATQETVAKDWLNSIKKINQKD